MDLYRKIGRSARPATPFRSAREGREREQRITRGQEVLVRPIDWPQGKRFAFTIFDDPDLQSDRDGKLIYDFLADLELKTTRAIWPLGPEGVSAAFEGHCEQPQHVAWLLQLREGGFELGLHNARMHTSGRGATIRAIAHYRELFGEEGLVLANHMDNEDAIYWGSARLSGSRRILYDLATRGHNRNRFHGHEEGHDLFWGDICQREVAYVRNFVFRGLNTLAECPWMPYHDPARPHVNQWFASSEGAVCSSFVHAIRDQEQDRIEEEGGACILYTHFAMGFVHNGRIDPVFRERMTRLARRDGWFVPVRTILDFIRAQRGEHVLTDQERAKLEWKWLLTKLRYGTS